MTVLIVMAVLIVYVSCAIMQLVNSVTGPLLIIIGHNGYRTHQVIGHIGYRTHWVIGHIWL